MQHRKLALRYAQALLAALPDPAQQEAADNFLVALADAIESHRELRDLLLDPAIPQSARRTALDSIAREAGAPRIVHHFLATVVDHGRTVELPAMARVFREVREKAAGIVPATLTTATPLGPDLQDKARSSLETMTGRKVNLSCAVEPSLIGGAVAQIGSMVYDGSLKTQLARLRRRMAEE